MSVPRIDLDFGPRRRRADPAALAMLAAGAAVAAFALLRVADALAERNELRADLARIEAARDLASRPPPRRTAEPRVAAQLQVGRQVAQSLASPWADLLEAVEQRPPQDVALLAVEPSAARHTVRITAEARDARAMLAHLALLQRDGRLSDTVLVSHQRQQQAPGNPWRYQIQATW
ncbi:MAG: hypothetical protein U1F50_03430 [Rubrivivax sp.]